MKLELGYAGDSSDGEDQDEKEDLYLINKDYIPYIKAKLKPDIYQYEYVFKDIGGRLLHNKNVTRQYLKYKTSYYSLLNIDQALTENLKAKTLEITDLIADKYIVGKLISSKFKLNDEEAEKYFHSNEQNIKRFIAKRLKLIFEEESFLTGLKNLIENLDGIFNLGQFQGLYANLYEYLLSNWENNSEMVSFFLITPDEKNINIFKSSLSALITKSDLTLIHQEHKNDHYRQQILNNKENQVIYFLKNIFADSQVKAIKPLLESGISSLGLFAESDDAADFLAKVRTYHKLMRGILKYTFLENDPLPTHELSLVTKVGTAIDKDSCYPALGKLQIDEVNKLYKSGARSVMVYGSTGRLGGKYEELLLDIKELARKIDLKSCVKNILIGKASQNNSWKDLTSQEQHYLYDLTFLFFCCETTRNVSAFLTNAMFFDLLGVGYYKIEQLTTHLPISMEKAVSTSIKSNDILKPKYGETDGMLSSVLYYDFRLKTKEGKAEVLNQRGKMLFNDWFFFYKILTKDCIKKFFELTTQDSIRDLEVAMGSEVITNLEDKTQLIANIIDQSFCVIKSEYTANLTMAAIGTKLITDIEVKEVPARVFHELINDWYGLEISYLGEGAIIFDSE